jgi:hypothetical protein
VGCASGSVRASDSARHPLGRRPLRPPPPPSAARPGGSGPAPRRARSGPFAATVAGGFVTVASAAGSVVEAPQGRHVALDAGLATRTRRRRIHLPGHVVRRAVAVGAGRVAGRRAARHRRRHGARHRGRHGRAGRASRAAAPRRCRRGRVAAGASRCVSAPGAEQRERQSGAQAVEEGHPSDGTVTPRHGQPRATPHC